MKFNKYLWFSLKAAFLFILTTNLLLMMIGNQIALEMAFRPRGKLPFNQDQWIEGASDGIRYEMADAIIDGNLLIGKSRLGVEQLLGKPIYTVKGSSSGSYLSTYMLSLQHSHPASFFLLPVIKRGNSDCWVLNVEFKDFLVSKVSVGVT